MIRNRKHRLHVIFNSTLELVCRITTSTASFFDKIVMELNLNQRRVLKHSTGDIMVSPACNHRQQEPTQTYSEPIDMLALRWINKGCPTIMLPSSCNFPALFFAR